MKHIKWLLLLVVSIALVGCKITSVKQTRPDGTRVVLRDWRMFMRTQAEGGFEADTNGVSLNAKVASEVDSNAVEIVIRGGADLLDKLR